MLSNLYSDLKLCIASDTFGILAYSALCFFLRYMPAYSNEFSVAKVYSLIHIEIFLRHKNCKAFRLI